MVAVVSVVVAKIFGIMLDLSDKVGHTVGVGLLGSGRKEGGKDMAWVADWNCDYYYARRGDARCGHKHRSESAVRECCDNKNRQHVERLRIMVDRNLPAE